MFKKILLLLFIILCSFCLVNAVSAMDCNNVTSDNVNEDNLAIAGGNSDIDENTDYLAESNDEIISHDSDYPWVEFYSPINSGRVSGIVNIDLNVDSHSDLRYANVTIESVKTREVVFRAQDTNPSDGWGVSWDTSNFANGKYYITAYVINVLDLDDSYSILVDLNNKEKDTHIVLNNSVGVVGESSTIVAQLYDGNSVGLPNKVIEFTVGGETLTAKTGADGIALVNYVPKEFKNYDVVAKFKGDNLYSASQSSMVFKSISNSNATVVTISNVTGNRNQVVALKANLKTPGFVEDRANKKITFYINNNAIGSSLTDNMGNAEFLYNLSEVGGSYIYSARYCDANNDTFAGYASLYVPESEIYMTMNAVTYSVDGIFTVGNKFKLNLIVNNKGPDAASNTLLQYTVPSSLKYITADASQGSITFNSTNKLLTWNLGNVSLGSQTLEVTFQALSATKNNLTSKLSTDSYVKSISTAVPVKYLTVNAYSLKANNLVKYYGGTNKFKAYMTTKDGNAVPGAIIKIIINKQTLNLKTNGKGFVQLDINLKPGTYNIKVSCNKFSMTKKVVIKPVLITKNLAKKQSKVTKFTAKLLNANGKAAANKVVSFKVDGKKYSAKTNKNGIAVVSLMNLKVGKHSVVTSYEKSMVKNSITIKK